MVARRFGGCLAAVAVAAGVVASASCGLSLDYLSNGAPEDAATPDAVLVDGQGGAPDGDGGAPAGDASAWCAAYPTAFFCADFDEGSLVDAYERGVLVTIPKATTTSGDASLSSTVHSPPWAFAAGTAAIVAGSTALSRFEEPASAPSIKHQEIRFDLRLPAFTPGADVNLASLDMDPPSGGARVRASVSITTDGRGELWLDNGAGVQQSAPFPLPANLATTWHTFDLRLDVDPSLTALLTADGNTTPVAQVTTLTAGFTTARSATFYVGLSVTGPSSPMQAVFDDVLVTVQ